MRIRPGRLTIVLAACLTAWGSTARALAAAPVAISVNAARSTGAYVNQNVAGVAFREGAGSELRALGTTFTRYGAGVNDRYGQLRDLFPRAPTGRQTAATVPFDRRALARYERDVNEMFASGAQPMITLDAPGWVGLTGHDGRYPPNPNAYQTLVERVVTRFTAYRLAHHERPILYWDAWNEPDNPLSTYWVGTEQQWLADALAPAGRAVRQVARRTGLKLRFGGCACWIPDPGWMGPMLAYAKAGRIRLDFITWHNYGNYPFLGPDGPEVGYSTPIPALDKINPDATPATMGEQVDQVRALARQQLGYVPELINNEWNLSAGGLDRRQDTNSAAAFDAATLIEFQQHGLGAAAFETAIDPFPSLNGQDLHGDLGLQTGQGQRKPSWWTFKLFGKLAPRVLTSSQTGARPVADGVFSLASRSPSGTRVTIMVASWKAVGGADWTVDLQVRNLRRGHWTAAVYRIDSRHRQAERASATVNFTGRLHASLPQRSLMFLVLDRSSS